QQQQQWQQPAPQAFPPAQPPRAAADPFAAPKSPLAGTTVQPSTPIAAAPMMAPMHSKNPPAPPMTSHDMAIFTADLGAHRPRNFYKGLSGNDISDHGGIFVATYMIPKVGTPIRVKISLPGGYEFEANAVVKWRREMSEGGDPGFGAQFTQITPEAR